jgi:hypothetical protein
MLNSWTNRAGRIGSLSNATCLFSINLEVLFDFLQLANARLKLEHHFRDATKVTEVKFLDKQGWEDRLALERDLSLCEDELFFMMKAITT